MAARKNRSAGAFLIFLFSSFTFCRSFFLGAETFERQLLVELNPGHPTAPPGDLLHVRALGQNDTLHFLFCSLGAPTLLLVHTNSSSSTVKVNWTRFEDDFKNQNGGGGLKVEPESSVLSSTAVTFTRLLEYADLNNTADPNLDFFSPYDLSNFTWSHLNLSGPIALLCGADASFANGSLCFQLSVFGSEGRGLSSPHLLHTANSSQMEVWLSGLPLRSNYSRFQLELQAVGGSYPLNRVDVHRSIDDEFTPSIFKVSQWVSAMNSSSDVLGFVQWKPVAYRRPNPTLEYTTACRHSAPRPQSGKAMESASALIRAFYSNPEVFGLNVSFGLAGDPFYNSTEFLSWTVLVGIGFPPVDSFSPLVVAIMAVALGTPLILLLVGGVCVCVRKRAAALAMAYHPIN